MSLAEFIRGNHDAIVSEWEAFAATLTPAARGLSRSQLRDHAHEILAAIVADLEVPQAAGEQSEKSKGRGLKHRMEAVGQVHAALRIHDGFKLGQLVAEYRALRASVLRLFEEAGGKDMRQVIRFNEAIDEALVEATNRYIQEMERTRDQFLAILGHDLRNPLSAILMSSALLTTPRGGEDRGEDRTAKVAMRILTSAERMKRMVNDLLDLTRTRLGVGIPISPRPMSLDDLSQGVLAEFQAFNPGRRFDFRSEGDLRGVWDSDRLAQALSNLVGNALQHGAPGGPVAMVARAEAEDVVIEVHNEGPTIPRAQFESIFDPLVRNPELPEEQGSTSLGLGLYITREIVAAHGGTVMVTSTEREGTTFSVRLPRHAVAQDMGEQPEQHGGTGGAAVH
jgi:signal transduction histidine kinase